MQLHGTPIPTIGVHNSRGLGGGEASTDWIRAAAPLTESVDFSLSWVTKNVLISISWSRNLS